MTSTERIQQVVCTSPMKTSLSFHFFEANPIGVRNKYRINKSYRIITVKEVTFSAVQLHVYGRPPNWSKFAASSGQEKWTFGGTTGISTDCSKSVASIARSSA